MKQIHLSVGQRVALGFAAMILLVVLASGVGLLYSRSANTALDRAHNNSNQIELVRSLQLQWTSVVEQVDSLLLTRQTSMIDVQINQEIAAFNQQLADLQKQSIGQNPVVIAENREIIKDLQQLGAELTNIVNQISEYANAGSWARAQTLRFTEMTSLQRRLTENLDQLGLNMSQSVDEEVVSSKSQQDSTRAQLISIIIFAMLMSSALAYFTTRSITQPVAQLLNNVQRIMNRDFSHQEVLQRQDEFGKLSQATSLMTNLLKETYEQLEKRVTERTRNLELAGEIGRTVSQVRALDVMLMEAAELIRSQFDLYYVQVYLTNPSQTVLLLQSGTGTVGTELLSREHKLPLNTASINGRAAIEKHSIVITDTTTSSTFKPNLLLPDTRSEMAVPLLIGEKVVGVLDLQSREPGKLNQGILSAFEALAGQLAIAIQNATFLAETEQARAEVEAQAQRLSRSNWVDYLDAIHQPEKTGFVFEKNQIALMTQAEQSQPQINVNALTAAISVTGEALGNLVVEMEDQSPIMRTSELVETVARQVSQQIENLRLLDSAERYRFEAEQASRRNTQESWKDYKQANVNKSMSYIYDLKEVRPYLSDEEDQPTEKSAYNLPIKVRDETIGKLVVQGLKSDDTEAIELANAIVERLGTHIESLRLSGQTEQALATTQKQAMREQALRQITSAVRSSTDPATILRTAAKELGTLLGRKTIVRLTTEHQSHHPADLLEEAITNNGNETVSPTESQNTIGGDQ